MVECFNLFILTFDWEESGESYNDGSERTEGDETENDDQSKE